MIVKSITKQVDIPHEPGEWMLFKRLSWRQLDEASDIASDASFERIKKMGVEMVQALRTSVAAPASAANYDRAYVLNTGILKWSYSDAVNPENIDALDEATAAWAYAEILKLNEDKDAKNA